MRLTILLKEGKKIQYFWPTLKMQLNPYSLWEITVFPSVLMVACLLWRSRRDFQGDGHNPWASQNRWEHSRLFCCSSKVGHQRPVMGTNGPRLCVLIQAAQTHPRDITGWKDQEHHLSKMSTSLSCSLPASLPSPRVVKVKSESHWKEKENALYSLLSFPESTALVSSYRKEAMLASSEGCGLRRSQTQKRKRVRMLLTVQLPFQVPVYLNISKEIS